MNERRRVDAESRAKFGALAMIGVVSTVFWLVGTIGLVTWTNWDNLQQQRFFCSDVQWNDLASAASAGLTHVPRPFHKDTSCESIRIMVRHDDPSFFMKILIGPPLAGWLLAFTIQQAVRFTRRNKRTMTLAE